MSFDPNKHRKTSQKLATLQNNKQTLWKIDKPKKKDYVRIYGEALEDLHVVNCFDQRDGVVKKSYGLFRELMRQKKIRFLLH